MRAVGIDVGATVVWAVAADGGRISGAAAFGVDELERLRTWCGTATVAIDAPAAASEGRHLDDTTLAAKFRPARCAEVALGRAGYWVPFVTGAGPFASWMEAGFAVYDALAHLSPLEVYPHAVFRELAGGPVPKKSTPAGRRARVALLPPLPPGADRWGHDAIDAAAACVVAVDHAAGRARPVRCADHAGSVMWLPAARGG